MEGVALFTPVSSAEHGKFPDQHIHIERCTFGEQARNRMDKNKRESQKNKILQSVCALLNSGGGVITVGIENNYYVYKTMGLGLDLEGQLTQLVNPSVMEDFIEFIPSSNTMQLYVKSWCQNGQRARLCSIDSGLRKRSGASTPNVNPDAVLDFIKKKPKVPIRQPLVKKTGLTEGNTLIYQKAQAFYDEENAHLGKSLDFSESANVELKSFDREANLEKRLKEALPKYVSAFANTTGGFLFIGVDDKTKKVVGCGEGMEAWIIEQMVQNICEKAKTLAFHLSDCDKNHWSVDYKVFKVLNSSNEKPRYVIAFKIPAFCCAVFEENPKCWHVENDRIKRLDPRSWLEKMQLSVPEDKLIKSFQNVLSLKDSPPQCRPVYSTENITQLQERIFPVQGDTVTIVHQSLPPELSEKYSTMLQSLVDLNSGPGVLVFSTSWAVDINLPRNNDILCEALLITPGSYPTLFSWVERGSEELWQSVKSTAFSLKQKLVNLGGYTGRLCVIPQLVDCQTGELIHNETDDAPLYPESYSLDHDEEVKALLKSLTIVLLHFTSPMSDALGCEFFNLLTEEQFKILNVVSEIKHLFIHGPPGSGKTLIALKKMQMIKNSDNCDQTNILYLCENVGLRNFVSKQSLCLCETRASFMKNSAWYSESVKHIFVDEGQTFRVEHGDWYKKAKSLTEGKHGVFWIFLDYFQKSHTEEDGLPSLIVQEKAYLTQVVRNSKAIFDAMSGLLGNIAENSKPEQAAHLRAMREKVSLSHSFRGEFVCKSDLLSVEQEVVKIVKRLLKRGHSARDIAVLFSNQVELDKREYQVRKERLPVQFGKVDDMDQDKIVLDTIRRFSGLERNIVIVVDPIVHSFHSKIQPHFLLSAFSRARIRLYLLQSRP